MSEVRKDGKLYAVLLRSQDWTQGISFVTPDDAFCQVGTWWLQPGKYDAHKHVSNERPNVITQECVIVMNGAVRVTVYDDDDDPFWSEVLNAGDLLVALAGGHGYEILMPDSKVIEAKNGPYVSAEVDKRLIGPVEQV